jgi:hypothetical protein
MGAAVGIEVMRQHVRGFLLVPLARWLHLWGLGRWDAFGLPRHSGKCSAGASDDSIGGFALGRVVAGWQRNELAEAQFNKSEV